MTGTETGRTVRVEPKLHADGLWHAWVEMGRDPVTKKRKRRHVKRADRDEVIAICVELMHSRSSSHFNDDEARHATALAESLAENLEAQKKAAAPKPKPATRNRGDAPKKKRSARGYGSQPRLHSDGLWHAWVDLGTDPQTHVRDRRHIARASRDEVVEAHQNLLAVRGQIKKDALDRLPKAGTAAEWFWTWLFDDVRANRKRSTFSFYEGFIRRTIVPAIGDIKLTKLTEKQIQKMIDEIPTRPMREGCLSTVKAGLAEARQRRLVTENVADLVKLARPKPILEDEDDFDFEDLDFEDGEVSGDKVLQDNETQRVFLVAVNKPNYPRWVIALLFGLRQSEVLGLVWTDLDWDTGVLTVRRNYNRASYDHGCVNPASCGHSPGRCPNRVKVGRVDKTKSKSGFRKIPLGEGVLSVLKQHLRQQRLDRMKSGAVWPRVPWMFTDEHGRPIQHRADYDAWKAILAEAGVSTDHALHDARHSAATAMGAAGVDDATMQRIFGWSTRRMIEVYRHVIDERVKEASLEREAVFKL